MNYQQKVNNFIWFPRVIVIAFVLFISLFSFDAFSDEAPFGAGLLFIFMAVVFTLFFNTYNDTVSLFLVTFPLIVAGILFLVSYILAKKQPHN